MNKQIAIQNSEINEAVNNYFKNKNVSITYFDKNVEYDRYDFVILNDSIDFPDRGNIINIHPSLLPSFEGENAIERAFLSGVKVSGITIHSKNKIIAQYPVLIGIDTHIDEFIKDITDVKKRLVPAVIESLINDTVFDFQDLFKNHCSHSSGTCGNCKGCHQ